MRGRWRPGAESLERRAPVEMRFIDMFMTALGSLLFLSVLLSYLLVNRPPPGSPNGTLAGVAVPFKALSIVSQTLCPAYLGEPYHCALAYRGGSGDVNWTLSLGEPPDGIVFDPASGIFSGTPESGGTVRFTIEAADARGAMASPRDYELTVTAPLITAKRVNLWVSVALAALLAFAGAWYYYKAVEAGKVVAVLENAAREGQESITLRSGTHSLTTIKLPKGIGQYKRHAATAREWAMFASVGAAVIAAYIAWVLLG